MGVWSSERYKASSEKVLNLLKEIKNTGNLPEKGDYNYYVIYGTGECRIIELPQESFENIKDEIMNFPFIKVIREYEIGYNFYESALIKVCL